MIPRTAPAWTGVAARFYHRGQNPLAIAAANAALRFDPAYARAWFVRARARRDSGDPDGAMRDFTEGLRLDPASRTGRASRACLLYDHGFHADALAEWDRCRADGADSDWHALRSFLCRYALGRRSEARRLLAARFSGRADADPWTGAIARHLCGELPARELMRMADTGPRRCEAHFYAGEFLRLQGKATEAERELRACVGTGMKRWTEWRSAAAKVG